MNHDIPVRKHAYNRQSSLGLCLFHFVLFDNITRSYSVKPVTRRCDGNKAYMNDKV